MGQSRTDLRVIPVAEAPAQAAARLQAEAAAMAAEAVQRVLLMLDEAAEALVETAELTAAPPGVRDECRRMAEEITARASTMRAILGRAL